MCYFCGKSDFLYDLKVQKSQECQKYDFFKRKPKLKKSIKKSKKLARALKYAKIVLRKKA